MVRTELEWWPISECVPADGQQVLIADGKTVRLAVYEHTVPDKLPTMWGGPLMPTHGWPSFMSGGGAFSPASVRLWAAVQVPKC